MKKLILLTVAVLTSIGLYMNAETNTSKCQVCEKGTLRKANKTAIFEISDNVLKPRLDATFLKCDHCQSYSTTQEYNGYFSIPAPK